MEAYEEQLDRVKLMAAGDDTWDLSLNDTAALMAVVTRLEAVETALGSVVRVWRRCYGDLPVPAILTNAMKDASGVLGEVALPTPSSETHSHE
jgi:hypothetical protein